MQYHHITHLGQRFKSLNHTHEVDREIVRAEVRIRLTSDGRVDQGPYLMMVDPGRIRDPDSTRSASFC